MAAFEYTAVDAGGRERKGGSEAVLLLAIEPEILARGD